MFWERAYYALILLIELAQGCRKNGVELSSTAEIYDLSIFAFNSILEQLEQAGYITCNDGSLFLQMEPDKISIWDIVKSLDQIQGGELKQEKQQLQTSTAIMVDKEIEVMLKMIRFKFQHHTLSAWSKKASKLLYI